MKKILSFLLLLAGVTTFTSCSDNDATYSATDPLSITLADVLFGAGGGDGSIVANTTATLTATTNADWLSLAVNGNTVTVTSQPNTSLEARSAKIVVTASDGTTANVIATQHGLLLALNARTSYLFSSNGNEPGIIYDKSNVDFEQVVSDDWIHLEKTEEGYAITVDDNTGEYRHGTIRLSFPASDFTQVINIGQWGDTFPFAGLNTATYEDAEGNSYTKTVSVVADETDAEGDSYLVKGLMDEGDLLLTLNTRNTDAVEYYVSAGYSPGTLIEDGTTYTLRCLLSVYNVNTGSRYYPTQVTTVATSAYRMAFEWMTDEDANPSFNFVRNDALSATYTTDGIIVCKFTNTNTAAAAARKGIAYEFLNLKITSK
ncbi:MAG: hypothetical protein IJ190_04030 [Prevotella sp.]|nr:hypothetical protein [Prevotella sp.]